jgi:hypothetical protein
VARLPLQRGIRPTRLPTPRVRAPPTISGGRQPADWPQAERILLWFRQRVDRVWLQVMADSQDEARLAQIRGVAARRRIAGAQKLGIRYMDRAIPV